MQQQYGKKNSETQEGQPAMLVKHLAYHDDKLVEYTISVARGDKMVTQLS
ncbi:UTRA domain-containing protein [Oceanobacillus sp. AG]|nr:UTRA domain-containing protein [Oceanobacillus sp. AG]